MPSDRLVTLTTDHLKRAFARTQGYGTDWSYREAQAVEGFLDALREEDDATGSSAFEPVLLSTIDASPPPPLLLGRLDPVEHTILYGPGGVGKGALTAQWIATLTQAGTPVMILDYEGHDGEWSRRIDGLRGDLESVAYIAPLRAGLGAIWEHVASIRACAEANPGLVLVIDSAVMAVAGADPMDPETPGRYFAALQQIGAPSLTLAHVTKLHDPRYPFGSAFWHNLARVTWSLMPKGEDILLQCQKASNWAKPPAATVEMTWWNGMLTEVTERKAVERLMDRIVEVLADGPATVAAIASALNDGLAKEEHVEPTTIRRTLVREVGRPGARVTKMGDQWRLREDD